MSNRPFNPRVTQADKQQAVGLAVFLAGIIGIYAALPDPWFWLGALLWALASAVVSSRIS